MDARRHTLCHAVFSTLLLLGCLQCAGQDLIVTTAGDSIECTIRAVREKKLHYSIAEGNRKKNRTIEREQIRSYRRAGFAPVDLGVRTFVPNQQPVEQRRETARDSLRKVERKPAWGVFGGYGWTHRVGRADDDTDQAIQDHLEGLRSGSQFTFSFNYFIRKHFGIGLRAAHSVWSNSSPQVPFAVAEDSTIIVDLETDLRVTTIGPALLWRPTSPSDKTIFIVVVSSGMSFYQENNLLDGIPLNVYGRSTYASAAATLDFRLTENFVVGGNVGFTVGNVRNLTFTYADGTDRYVLLPVEQAIGLQRLHFGLQLGLVF